MRRGAVIAASRRHELEKAGIAAGLLVCLAPEAGFEPAPLINSQLNFPEAINYALRNADCRAKDVALRHTRHGGVRLAPAYDMITTAACADYAKNPPAIAFMGKKTWSPDKSLQTFIAATFGLPPRGQVDIVERIGGAMAEVGPRVRETMADHPGFAETGERMLLAWQEGLDGLRDKRIYALGEVELGVTFTGFSEPKPTQQDRTVVGGSGLPGKR